MNLRRPRSVRLATLALALLAAPAAAAQGGAADPGRPAPAQLEIRRASGAITVDGVLDDAGWKDATPVSVWFETNPGDNVEPAVANTAWLAYDDEFFYAAFRFADPDPAHIRAPFGDHDQMGGSPVDYGGVILDTRHDGKTAQMFLANPRGIQYDALSSDVSGEDASPDWFWDSAARVTPEGWELEIRIPFSSLRYKGGGEGSRPQTWAVLLYRNHPRDFRHQYFSTRLPREVNCFICNATPLVGLAGLPSGSHWVAAPYASGSRERAPEGGEPGAPLLTGDVGSEIGLDAKWLPNPDHAIDLTLNPDFSQVESDTAQISTNERFALFVPEKRPFFLEGVDLFSTPFQAVYTRTVTAPRWGVRTTGALGDSGYTLLVADDRGGGLVLLPGVESSDYALQDFDSKVVVGRYRHAFGLSFASLLVSTREIDGGGYNRVVGPDFQWRPNDQDTVSGQFLWSTSTTPYLTDLATGEHLDSATGTASDLWYNHSDGRRDLFVELTDVGEGFRSDNGFLPQVGYRREYLETGYTFRPQGPLRRIRAFAFTDQQQDQEGDALLRLVSAGVGMDGPRNLFVRARLQRDTVRSGGTLFDRDRLYVTANGVPGRLLSYLSLDGWIGDDTDFAGLRPGSGASLTATATVRPGDHLELALVGSRRWLDLDHGGGRLFTAEVERLRASWTFSSRAFVRLVGQRVEIVDGAAAAAPGTKDGDLTASALFGYKLNWQTVLYVGFGDQRALVADLAGEYGLEPAAQEIFVKVSYALQR